MARFDFNADEIFEMAEQIERNGTAFYKKAASFNEGGVKKLLLDLASWEADHEDRFKEMRSDLSSLESQEQFFDPDEETAKYLRAFADRHVFDTRKKPEDLLDGEESLEEILRMAIGLEKDSIVFYLGLRDATRKETGKQKVEGIIKEEMRHVSTLSDELRRALEAR
mgnify:CR=1 FL=1